MKIGRTLLGLGSSCSSIAELITFELEENVGPGKVSYVHQSLTF